jgi:hypothetical protein
MNIIQEEAMEVNEDLRKIQSQVFHTLGDVQRHYDDLVMLQEQVDEQRSKYKEAQHAFDKVAELARKAYPTPETLPIYSAKHKMKNQILFDSYKEIFDEVKEAQEMATKACIRIWKSSDEDIRIFQMETMTHLEEAGPSELKLKDVTENRDASREEISHIKKVTEIFFISI